MSVLYWCCLCIIQNTEHVVHVPPFPPLTFYQYICMHGYRFNLLLLYTVPKVIDFPRYNMKCSGENVILRGIVHVVSGFPLHSCYIAEIWIAFLTGYIMFRYILYITMYTKYIYHIRFIILKERNINGTEL